MKELLCIALALALLFPLSLAAIGWETVTDSGSTVARHRLDAAQSHLDHERQYTYRLSQILTEWESRRQLEVAKP